MAGSLNKVQLIGNLGKDPEVRTFNNGGKICNFSIATSESWKDKQTGEKKEKTEWHNITITGDGLVGVCERYLKKGSKVYIEGKMQTRKWQDRDGNDRWTTEVVVGFGGQMLMLGGNDGSGGGSRGGQRSNDYDRGGSSGGGNNNSGGGRVDDDFDLDDEIPF